MHKRQTKSPGPEYNVVEEGGGYPGASGQYLATELVFSFLNNIVFGGAGVARHAPGTQQAELVLQLIFIFGC